VRLKVHGEECAAESPAGSRGRAAEGVKGSPMKLWAFSPGVKGGFIVFLKMLQDVPLGQAYSQVRHYGGGGGGGVGGVPHYFIIGSAQIS